MYKKNRVLLVLIHLSTCFVKVTTGCLHSRRLKHTGLFPSFLSHYLRKAQFILPLIYSKELSFVFLMFNLKHRVLFVTKGTKYSEKSKIGWTNIPILIDVPLKVQTKFREVSNFLCLHKLHIWTSWSKKGQR